MENLIIRKSKLEPLTEEGIPKDFSDKMEYFNRGLNQNTYPFIPRKNLITLDEIKTLWIPSAKDNLDIVAELNEKVIGSGTVFYKVNSTAYSQAGNRTPGEIALTIDSNFSHEEIGMQIIKKIIEELKINHKKAVLHTDINFLEEIKMMKKLGIKSKPIKGYKRYIEGGLSGEVFEYQLP